MVTEKVLMTGNEAACRGAILAGCRYYYGYPITPQNECTAYMAANMPRVGGVFIQSESELAAISMVHGTSAAGGRAMTSSSSPGISLKQEGISYLAGSELPAVIVNVQRAGPGLGYIGPAQGDYFQAVKGGDTATTGALSWRRQACRRCRTWCGTALTSRTSTGLPWSCCRMR